MYVIESSEARASKAANPASGAAVKLQLRRTAVADEAYSDWQPLATCRTQSVACEILVRSVEEYTLAFEFRTSRARRRGGHDGPSTLLHCCNR